MLFSTINLYDACQASYKVLKPKYHSLTEDSISDIFITLFTRKVHERYQYDSLLSFNSAVVRMVENAYIDILRTDHSPVFVSLDAPASDNGESFADRYNFDVVDDDIDDSDDTDDDLDLPLDVTTFIRFKTLHKKLQTKFFSLKHSTSHFFSTPFSIGCSTLDHCSKRGLILSDGSLIGYPSEYLKTLCLSNYATLSRRGSLQ